MAASTLPLGLVFRLALAVVLDTAVHIVWKLAVLQLPNPGALSAALEAASREPLFSLVAALFVWQLVNWLQVLEGWTPARAPRQLLRPPQSAGPRDRPCLRPAHHLVYAGR